MHDKQAIYVNGDDSGFGRIPAGMDGSGRPIAASPLRSLARSRVQSGIRTRSLRSRVGQCQCCSLIQFRHVPHLLTMGDISDLRPDHSAARLSPKPSCLEASEADGKTYRGNQLPSLTVRTLPLPEAKERSDNQLFLTENECS